jgi:hypothetical protein
MLQYCDMPVTHLVELRLEYVSIANGMAQFLRQFVALQDVEDYG